MQNFKRLRVWQNAVALALNVRRATECFPPTGYSELKGQMTSSAESIVANIVEGCGAATPKEFARFLTIAIKSAMELEGQLGLARMYGILAGADSAARTAETITLRRMIYALRKKVESPPTFPPPNLSKSISHRQPTTEDPQPKTVVPAHSDTQLLPSAGQPQ